MNKEVNSEESQDNYAFGMDWGEDQVSLGELTNYRQYQYDLVGDHIGKEIFEVGSGASRSFTKLILKNKKGIKRLLSIEPSEVLMEDFKNKGTDVFPDFVEFQNKDIFQMNPAQTGKFDTIIYIHVLEHIEEDRKALNYSHQFLKEDGKVLIEVPALPFLFSVHDEMLGHYRRYTKKMLRNIVDPEKYTIEKLWYNDPIGVVGSFIFFKMRKVKLNSKEGISTVKNQGKLYDKYLIPLQGEIEKYITFPFGLSVNAILKKK